MDCRSPRLFQDCSTALHSVREYVGHRGQTGGCRSGRCRCRCPGTSSRRPPRPFDTRQSALSHHHVIVSAIPIRKRPAVTPRLPLSPHCNERPFSALSYYIRARPDTQTSTRIAAVGKACTSCYGTYLPKVTGVLRFVRLAHHTQRARKTLQALRASRVLVARLCYLRTQLPAVPTRGANAKWPAPTSRCSSLPSMSSSPSP